MFRSDLPPSFHHGGGKKTRDGEQGRGRQREAKGFKGWQQHHGLEVLSLLLTVQGREEVEGLGAEGKARGSVGGIAMKPSSPPPPPRLPPPPPSLRHELSRIVSRWSSYQLKTNMNQVKICPR